MAIYIRCISRLWPTWTKSDSEYRVGDINRSLSIAHPLNSPGQLHEGPNLAHLFTRYKAYFRCEESHLGAPCCKRSSGCPEIRPGIVCSRKLFNCQLLHQTIRPFTSYGCLMARGAKCVEELQGSGGSLVPQLVTWLQLRENIVDLESRGVSWARVRHSAGFCWVTDDLLKYTSYAYCRPWSTRDCFSYSKQ